MEWADRDVWRRRRSYITAELRKDLPGHLTHLGAVTGSIALLGVVEGARLCALQGDFRFPIRYALYNVVPTFVGGKVSAVDVASTMKNAPPLRTCPRALAQAYILQATRTAMAGCTVLSVLLQVALASSRGAETYERALLEGREVPNVSMTSGTRPGGSSCAEGVVRLCGIHGLEAALRAAWRGAGVERPCRASILPVLISSADAGMEGGVEGGSSSSSSGDGVAAARECRLHPRFFRVDPRRLLSRQTWQPLARGLTVALESNSIGSSERDGSGESSGAALVIEADTLSSQHPEALLGVDAEARTAKRDLRGEGMPFSRGVQLEVDQALWSVTALRKALEETGRSREVTGVILAGARFKSGADSTVIIDARAALLASILAWTQHCPTRAPNREREKRDDADVSGAGSSAPDDSIGTESSVEAETGGLVVSGREGSGPGAVDAGVSTREKEEEELSTEADGASPDDEGLSRSESLLVALERTGSRTRELLTPGEQMRSAVVDALRAASEWFVKLLPGQAVGAAMTTRDGSSRILVYDTDDEPSFLWLAEQMSSQGWTVKRPTDGRDAHGSRRGRWTSHGLPRGDGRTGDYPILVHRSSDERSLTATVGHLSRGEAGAPVCAVVHSLDSAAEARRLVAEAVSGGGGAGTGACGSVVICTSEVAEDLLSFVRTKLQSGSTPGEVQDLLDSLLGRFYRNAP